MSQLKSVMVLASDSVHGFLVKIVEFLREMLQAFSNSFEANLSS
jgi:hypothetical protein